MIKISFVYDGYPKNTNIGTFNYFCVYTQEIRFENIIIIGRIVILDNIVFESLRYPNFTFGDERTLKILLGRTLFMGTFIRIW